MPSCDYLCLQTSKDPLSRHCLCGCYLPFGQLNNSKPKKCPLRGLSFDKEFTIDNCKIDGEANLDRTTIPFGLILVVKIKGKLWLLANIVESWEMSLAADIMRLKDLPIVKGCTVVKKRCAVSQCLKLCTRGVMSLDNVTIPERTILFSSTIFFVSEIKGDFDIASAISAFSEKKSAPGGEHVLALVLVPLYTNEIPYDPVGDTCLTINNGYLLRLLTSVLPPIKEEFIAAFTDHRGSVDESLRIIKALCCPNKLPGYFECMGINKSVFYYQSHSDPRHRFGYRMFLLEGTWKKGFAEKVSHTLLLTMSWGAFEVYLSDIGTSFADMKTTCNHVPQMETLIGFLKTANYFRNSICHSTKETPCLGR